MVKSTLNGISSCGVPCFACPSLIKGTCQGCRSEAPQKRSSKFGCKIRICSLTIKNVQFCYQCEEFPCKIIKKKLLSAHQGDKKYAYRFELTDNLQLIEKIGIEKGLKALEARWSCPECGGRIQFYHYICSDCGKDFLNKLPKMEESS